MRPPRQEEQRTDSPSSKSGIWYHTPEQKEEASAAIAQLQAQGRKVGTTLDPVGLWVDAEECKSVLSGAALGGRALTPHETTDHQKYHEKSELQQAAAAPSGRGD